MPLVNNTNKHHYFNNGGHHHRPAVALPRSLQQQQQQQQAAVEQHLQVNLNSPTISATAAPTSHHHYHQHGHHHQAQQQRGSRGTKELGMLVMLLTAEAVLLSGASTPSSMRSGVGMSVSSLTKAFSHQGNTKSNSNSNSAVNNNNNNKVVANSFDASCGSSAIASDSSSRESGNVSPTAAQESSSQSQGHKSGAETPKGSASSHHLQGSPSAPPPFYSGSSADDSASSHDDEDVIEVVDQQNNNNNNNNNQQHQLTFLNSLIIIENSKSAAKNKKQTNITQDLLNRVFEFLPWRDAAIARGTSKAWQLACSSINCLFFNLPKTAIPAVFVYSQVQFTPEEEIRIEPRFQHKSDLGKWKCEACNFVNGETRILCGSRTCQMPIPTHRSAARLFAGQLRREGSVPYLRWLLEDVVGSDKHEVRIKNVENHRDANTQRGKGCCWVYLEDLSMANPVVDMHHRLYSDVGPDGREGVWVVPEHCRSELEQEIEAVSYAADRPRALPRGALVVERPVMTPQMAPEKATISAKVVASHSAYSPTTNTTSYTNAAAAATTLTSSVVAAAPHHQHHHNQVPTTASSPSSSYPENIKMIFDNAELVQISPVKNTLSQGKRYSHNPYAFVVREKEQQQQQQQQYPQEFESSSTYYQQQQQDNTFYYYGNPSSSTIAKYAY